MEQVLLVGSRVSVRRDAGREWLCAGQSPLRGGRSRGRRADAVPPRRRRECERHGPFRHEAAPLRGGARTHRGGEAAVGQGGRGRRQRRLYGGSAAGDRGKLRPYGHCGIAPGSRCGHQGRNGRGKTVLHEAGQFDRVDVARALLAHGADVNAKDEDGDTPLHASLSHWSGAGIAEMLVLAGADVGAKNNEGKTPLHLAVVNYYAYAVNAVTSQDPNRYSTEEAVRGIELPFAMKMVKLLVDKGADVKAVDSGGGTPLHEAAGAGREEIVRFLVDKGADVNAVDSDGGTPLSDAAGWGSDGVVRFLLEKGARTDGDIGATAVHQAAEFGHPAVLRLLIARGAPLEDRGERLWTPLHTAALCGHTEVVELLLTAGASVDPRDRDGRTPLHAAMRDGHADVARCLLAHGANVNAKDAKGATPLLLALCQGRTEAAKLLVAAGACMVKLPNGPHDATLHTAIDANDTALAGLLLDNGADAERRDVKGQTPLHAAVAKGNVEVARLLLAHGADPGATNSIGMTALHYAAGFGHRELVLLLLANGGDAGAKDREGRTAADVARLRNHPEIAGLLAATPAKNEGTAALPSSQAKADDLHVDLSDAARIQRNVTILVRDNSAFALDLNRQLRSTSGNVFFSPHSISTALAPIYAAARGKTAKEMADTLHWSLGQADLHPAFGSLQAALDAIEQGGNVTLRAANALWPQQGHPFRRDYLSLVETHYRATLSPVDYSSQPAREAACGRINDWVADKTQGVIRDIVRPSDFTDLTRLVLTNAIYFKGAWARPFDPNKTKDAPFHVTSERSVQAAMMNRVAAFEYLETADLQVLRLPYRGDELSMLVLLPRAVDGLASLSARLTVQDIDQWRRNVRQEHVVVFLPRFKITFATELKPVLQAMGMVDAFLWPGANLAGFDGDPRSFALDAVIHKAFVDVNEEGTEAAAATAVAVRSSSAPPPPPEFRADHPFLFFIQDNRTGSILFLGRVVDPTSMGGE
ncbi:MAG: serpin family protein [Phycisphaerales bacterium]